MGRLAEQFRPLLKPWTLSDRLGRSIGYTNWLMWISIIAIWFVGGWFNWVIICIITFQFLQFVIHFKIEQRRIALLDAKYKKILDGMDKQ